MLISSVFYGILWVSWYLNAARGQGCNYLLHYSSTFLGHERFFSCWFLKNLSGSPMLCGNQYTFAVVVVELNVQKCSTFFLSI